MLIHLHTLEGHGVAVDLCVAVHAMHTGAESIVCHQMCLVESSYDW